MAAPPNRPMRLAPRRGRGRFGPRRHLAGRPGEREAMLRGGGVQSFIYEGCDALATLKSAYDILGIEIG